MLYGERGLRAFEVKRSARLRQEDFRSLYAFLEEYPMAKAHLAYGGTRSYQEGPIRVWPMGELLPRLAEAL